MFLYIVSFLNDLLYDYCDIIVLQCELVCSCHCLFIEIFCLGLSLSVCMCGVPLGSRALGLSPVTKQPWLMLKCHLHLCWVLVPKVSMHAQLQLCSKNASASVTWHAPIKSNSMDVWDEMARGVFFSCSLHPAVDLHVSLHFYGLKCRDLEETAQFVCVIWKYHEENTIII